LASRLETACRPGGILISHSTWALVHDQIDTRPHATIEVKGFPRPIRAYEIDLRLPDQRDPPAPSARHSVGLS
jgi:class 3 adenylate cyclase